MDNLIDIFYDVDDFCQDFIPQWEKTLIEDGQKKRRRKGRLSPSEIMTILIVFHQSHYRNFKHFYLSHVTPHLKSYFPQLLSYSRFVETVPSVIVPLTSYLVSLYGQPTGISFIDSTKIEVCHIIRAKRNKVFKDTAKHSKSSMGWFFGFKLHLIINHLGEILSVKITKANVDDRTPVPEMTTDLFGQLYGDKGYLGESIAAILRENDVELITNVRKNMKKKVRSLWDRVMLKKRFIIETVNDQLKNISCIEHTRHRSMTGFISNILGGLIAYCLRSNKPSLDLNAEELDLLDSANLTVA